MDDLGDPTAAVSKMQAVARAHQARQQFKKNKRAAVVVQSHYRGWRSRDTGVIRRLSRGISVIPSTRGAARRRSTLKLDRAQTRQVSLQAENIALANFKTARRSMTTHRLLGDRNGGTSLFQGSYIATKKQDQRRKKLLADARKLSPIDMALRFDLTAQTVLPKVCMHPVTWVVIVMFSATAVCTRLGIMTFSDLDRDTFDGSGVLVIFMIVFYVRNRD